MWEVYVWTSFFLLFFGEENDNTGNAQHLFVGSLLSTCLEPMSDRSHNVCVAFFLASRLSYHGDVGPHHDG